MKPKQFISSTAGEFIEALREGLGLGLFNEEEPHTAQSPKKHYTYGMQPLAYLLGCSFPTAHRIRKSETLDASISQSGKVIVIYVNLALYLLRLKNSKNNSFNL